MKNLKNTTHNSYSDESDCSTCGYCSTCDSDEYLETYTCDTPVKKVVERTVRKVKKKKIKDFNFERRASRKPRQKLSLDADKLKLKFMLLDEQKKLRDLMKNKNKKPCQAPDCRRKPIVECEEPKYTFERDSEDSDSDNNEKEYNYNVSISAQHDSLIEIVRTVCKSYNALLKIVKLSLDDLYDVYVDQGEDKIEIYNQLLNGMICDIGGILALKTPQGKPIIYSCDLHANTSYNYYTGLGKNHGSKNAIKLSNAAVYEQDDGISIALGESKENAKCKLEYLCENDSESKMAQKFRENHNRLSTLVRCLQNEVKTATRGEKILNIIRSTQEA